MGNVYLQRQVQFLRDQVANSVSAQQQRKPISTTKTLISTLVNRYDSEELHHKALRVNDKLKQLLPAYDLIDNGNLDQSCVNKYGLHLSRKGTIHLAYNFKQILSNHF